MRVTRTDCIERGRREERVLVVVFLRGGADGLSIVVPHGFDAYYRARPALAVPKSRVLRLDDRFGLHEGLRPIMGLWEAGALSVIHGVGSSDTSHSHFEAQDFMEHGGMPGAGWIARYLRAMTKARGAELGPLASVAIGTTVPESLRGAPGGVVIQRLVDFSLADDSPRILQSLGALYDADTTPLRDAARATLEAERRLRALRAEPEANGAAYPDSVLGRGLKEIAKLIRADVGLVATTVDAVGGALGWDTHFVQGTTIGALIEDVADSIAAFRTDLGGERERVTIVCMTEFGRRVAENTSLGTDHGAGSVMFSIGDDLPDGAGVRAGFDSLEPEALSEPGDVPVGIDFRDVLRPILEQHAPGIDMSKVFAG